MVPESPIGVGLVVPSYDIGMVSDPANIFPVEHSGIPVETINKLCGCFNGKGVPFKYQIISVGEVPP